MYISVEPVSESLRLDGSSKIAMGGMANKPGLKMYGPYSKWGIFHCYVSLPEGSS